ncbi:mitochondrial ATP synthase 6 kDa subunit [Micractinium conductrix]|uniref:Mitochondrial ATP synthase 6 kDa subunit n=1 Tax=Micractinium conductrix TaxID=554055 RepID=A0A2P6V2S4_9CHLO|nr:mitochondrial ATP synthase 6 kDa subunit [Micractinium conductrix]|eukprot:PSC68387.1 mitochondrial ATP synthase 6 kDa subunit [Micractinium conductrix]
MSGAAVRKYAAHAVTREAPLLTITRHVKQMWPFVAGFATTGYIFVQIASSVTDEDVKNSKFANPKH